MALTNTPSKLQSVFIQRNSTNTLNEQINVSGSDLIFYHSSSGEFTADKISVWASKYGIGSGGGGSTNLGTGSTYPFTSSFASTASVALNGGVTQIIAGNNITITPTNGLGQVTINTNPVSGSTTGSFKGTLDGTSSWSNNSIHAINSDTASYSTNFTIENDGQLILGTTQDNFASPQITIPFGGAIGFPNGEVGWLLYDDSLTNTFQFRHGISGLGITFTTESRIEATSAILTSVTASLQGTASWALNSLSSQTASFWNSSSLVTILNTKQLNLGSGSSYPITASWSNNSQTASYVYAGSINGKVTSSINADTASYLIPTNNYTANYFTASSITASNLFVYGISDAGSPLSILQTSNNNLVIGQIYNDSSTITFNVNTEDIELTSVAGKIQCYAPLSAYNGIYDNANDVIAIVVNDDHQLNGSSGQVLLTFVSNIDISTNLNVLGNALVTGSLSGSQAKFNGVTASLLGTASYSNHSTSASYSLSASYAPSNSTNLGTGSNYPITASWSNNSQTASYWDSSSLVTVLNTKQLSLGTGSNYPITTSWASNANTASYIYGGNVNGKVTSSINSDTASYVATASYSQNSLSASYAPSNFTNLGTGSSYPFTSSWSNNSQTASFWDSSSIATLLNITQLTLGTGSTYPFTSSWSNNAATASYIGTGTNGYFPYWSNNLLTPSSSLYISESKIAINSTAFNSIAPEQLLVSASSYNVISGYANINGYIQLNIQNTSNANSASSDIVATNDAGSENGNYIDFGINSSTYVPAGTVGQANDAYLYNTGSNLYIGNTSPNKNLYLFAGSTLNTSSVVLTATGNIGVGTISPINKLDVVGNISCSVITASLNGSASMAQTASYLSPALPYTTLTTSSLNWITCSYLLPEQFVTFTTGLLYNFTCSNLPDTGLVSNTTLFINNIASTTSSLAFPSDWKFIGSRPSSISSSRCAVLSLKAYYTTSIATFGIQY